MTRRLHAAIENGGLSSIIATAGGSMWALCLHTVWQIITIAVAIQRHYPSPHTSLCFCQQSGANHAVCNEYERAVLLLRWKWAVSCSVLCCECSWRPMRRTEFEKGRICGCHFSRIQQPSLNSKQSFWFGYILFSVPCQLPACPPAAVGNVLASLKQFFFFFPSPLNTHTPNSYTHARTLTHSKKQKTP